MIYFIKCGEFVKIGCSSDPQQRLEGIRVGNPYELKIIGLIDGGGEEEKRLHAAFEPFPSQVRMVLLLKNDQSFCRKTLH